MPAEVDLVVDHGRRVGPLVGRDLDVERPALHPGQQRAGVVVGVRPEPRVDVESDRAVDVAGLDEALLLLVEGLGRGRRSDPAEAGTEQHQRGNPVRVGRRHLQRHPAAERRARRTRRPRCPGRRGSRRPRPRSRAALARAERRRTREVRCEHPVPLGESGDLPRPHPSVGDAGVEEDDRRTGPGSVERQGHSLTLGGRASQPRRHFRSAAQMSRKTSMVAPRALSRSARSS